MKVEEPPVPVPYKPTHDESLRLDAAFVIATRRMPCVATTTCALNPLWVTGLFESLGGFIATDERLNMYVDARVKEWSVDHLANTLLHETGHPLSLHFLRARKLGVGPENFAAVNICQDIELWSWLSHLHFPHEHMSAELLSKQLKLKKPLPEGMPWEWYYKQLPKVEIKLPRGGCGSSSHGVPQDWEFARGKGKSPKEVEAIAHKTAQDIVDAASKKPGSVPESLLRSATQLLTPIVDWRREFAMILKRFCTSQVESNGWETYSQPNRRLAGVKSDLVFPSFEVPLPRVLCVEDTSGSVGATARAQARTEMCSIIQKTKAKLDVVAWDVVKHEHHKNPPMSLIPNLKMSGGGGTDMSAAIQWMDQQKTDVLVLLTDLFTPWPSIPPKKPLIVVAIDKQSSDENPDWLKVRGRS